EEPGHSVAPGDLQYPRAVPPRDHRHADGELPHRPVVAHVDHRPRAVRLGPAVSRTIRSPDREEQRSRPAAGTAPARSALHAPAYERARGPGASPQAGATPRGRTQRSAPKTL